MTHRLAGKSPKARGSGGERGCWFGYLLRRSTLRYRSCLLLSVVLSPGADPARMKRIRLYPGRTLSRWSPERLSAHEPTRLFKA